ncbi:MAG: hypothetical protein ACK4OF_05315 [Aquificaceae bacterium]
MKTVRLNPLVVIVALALFAFALDRYYRLRDVYYGEYIRHKEVMLLLNNYQTRQKVLIEEGLIRQNFAQVGADFVSFKQTDMGYEVRGKNLRGENLPKLIYSLESLGVEVLKLKAVDNTGQGLYDLQMHIR